MEGPTWVMQIQNCNYCIGFINSLLHEGGSTMLRLRFPLQIRLILNASPSFSGSGSATVSCTEPYREKTRGNGEAVANGHHMPSYFEM